MQTDKVVKKMKCNKVRKNLSAYLDNQLPITPALHDLAGGDYRLQIEEHLRSCLSCQEEYNLLQHLDGLLEKIEPITPSVNFHQELWRKVHSLKEETWLEKLGTFFPSPLPLTAKITIILLVGIFFGTASFLIRKEKIVQEFRNDYSFSVGLRSFADIPTNSFEEVLKLTKE